MALGRSARSAVRLLGCALALAGCKVHVVNEPNEPVPVVGEVAMSGVGTVQALQTGPWVVGVDPGQDALEFHMGEPVLLFDSDLLIVNDGATTELGPILLDDVSDVRLLTHAVNGEVRFEIRTDVPQGSIRLDQFELGEEDEAQFRTRLYELPGPAILVRLTEIGGPGGANARVVLVGR